MYFSKYSDFNLFRLLFLLILIVGMSLDTLSFAQPDPEVFASGLISPTGIEIDNRGWIWVAEQGTGNDDGRVSVVTAKNEVIPFITGLPSGKNATEEVTGTNHVYFNNSGQLMIVQGEGTDTLSQSILIMDTTGFSAESPPRERSDIKEIYHIGEYVLGELGFNESNPYSLTMGENNDLFIVDAAANSVIRRDMEDGSLSLFATFDDINNSTGIGSPMINVVPTGIVYKGENYLVSSFTGFPFPENAAKVYSLNSEGETSVFQDNLTTIVDLTTDMEDNLILLHHADFKAPPPFTSNSGSVIRHNGDNMSTLAEGINRPTGVRITDKGEIFISTLVDGQVLLIDASATGIYNRPVNSLRAELLSQNYPNPFKDFTNIEFTLPGPARVVLKLYDLQGSEVCCFINEHRPEGTYSLQWDGKNEQGQKLPAGIYIYKMQADEKIVMMRRMILLK